MCKHLCDKPLQRKSGSVVLTSDPGMLHGGGREGETEKEEGKEGEKKRQLSTHPLIFTKKKISKEKKLGCTLQPLNLKQL